MRVQRDVVVGAIGLAVAAGYYTLASDIQSSLLADAVGAQGLPKAYAAVLAALSLLVIAQATRRGDVSTDASHSLRLDVRAMGLLVFGAMYLVLVAPLGYLVSITVLIAGVALYTGAAMSVRLALISVAGAIGLWLVFAHLFQLGLPTGAVWQRLWS